MTIIPMSDDTRKANQDNPDLAGVKSVTYRQKSERLHLAGGDGDGKQICLIIVLPFPDPALFPNRSNGKHWSTRQPAKEQARTKAFSLSCHLSVDDTHTDHAMKIIVAPPDKRRRDVDGILSALKPSLDGIAQALRIDDNHFNPIEIKRVDPVKGGSVLITIE